jgi:hypothetical protein
LGLEEEEPQINADWIIGPGLGDPSLAVRARLAGESRRAAAGLGAWLERATGTSPQPARRPAPHLLAGRVLPGFSGRC